jgi:hypothetical protein
MGEELIHREVMSQSTYVEGGRLEIEVRMVSSGMGALGHPNQSILYLPGLGP